MNISGPVRLAGKPELRYTANQTAVCSVNAAFSRFEKGEETTDWYKLVRWGKQAEDFSTKYDQGDLLYISGEHKVTKYSNEKGDFKNNEVNVQSCRLLKRAGEGKATQTQTQTQTQTKTQTGTKPNFEDWKIDQSINLNEIPF